MSASELGGIYLDSYSLPAYQRLREAVSNLKRDDPLAPVTVVVPTRYASVALRRTLASEGGVANVQFLTIADLAGVLGETGGAVGGQRKLTRHLEAAAIRATAGGVDPGVQLAGVKDHPKLQASLRNTFRELERRSERELSRIEREGDAFRREVVRWYRRYRDRTGDCYGEERLAVEAATAVASGHLALDASGHVIVYLPPSMSPSETRLVEALYRSGRCTVIAGLLGDEAADAPALELARRLDRRATSSVVESSDAPRMPSDVRIVSAPDATEEVRLAVRSIMGRAGEGVPFHRCAVLYGQPEPYAQLIAGQFDLAGIPAAGPVRRRLSDTPPGKLLDLLLKAVDDGLTRSAVLRWVAEAPVRDPQTGHAAYDELLLWERISADAAVVGGEHQWLERLGTYRGGLASRIREYEDSDDVTPGTVAMYRRLFESSGRLMAFIETLAREAGRLRKGGFRESAEWCKRILEEYAYAPHSWPELGREALRMLEKEIDDVAALEARFPEFGADDFVAHLREALGASVRTLGPLGTGVFVGPLDAAQGMEFDIVCIVGMAEGSMPRRPADDPILPERVLSSLGGQLARGRRAEREAEDRRSYLCALSAGGSVILSYPRADPGGGREQYPSPWLLEAAERLKGEPVTSDELTRLSGEPWLTVVESVQHSLDLAGERGGADVHDFDLAALNEWRKARPGVRGHFLASEEPLRGALRMEGERLSRHFTAWDGDVSSVASGSSRLSRQREGVHSPTGLERWATCPYRYFLGDVLRVSALDAPGDELSISPIDKGSLVHEILERFMKESLGRRDVPEPGGAWGAESRSLMRSIAHEEFEKTEGQGKTGRRLLWRLASEEMVEDLERFLDEDEQWRSEGWRTAIVEQRFGISGRGGLDAAKLALPNGAEITFRGVIDRVDVSSDGTKAAVIDYKTGGKTAYRDMSKDPVDRGKRLQLPVYAAAIRSASGLPDRVGGFFWFVTSRGKFEKVEADLDDEDLKERFESVVSVVSSGIADGVFPARPGDRGWRGWENCRYCDFDRVCPSNRLRIWNAKKRDGAMAEYAELAGPDEDAAQ